MTSILSLPSQSNITDIAPSASIDRRLQDCVFVAFDTETTGLSPVACKLVELSGVKFKAGGAELSTFQALINPGIPIAPASTAVHGITDAMVAQQESFETVVPRFFNWATGTQEIGGKLAGTETILLAHNAAFDIGFLEVALAKLKLPMPTNPVLDTLSLSRKIITGSPNYRLQTLVEHLGIGSQTYHRALADSYHVRSIFLKMLEILPADTTFGDISLLGGQQFFINRSGANGQDQWQDNNEYVVIRHAINNGLDLRMFYKGARKTERTVSPKAVFFTNGMPYLTADCHLAEAERTFRIDRIVRIEALERKQ